MGMVQLTNTRRYSTDELRDAGASILFTDYYNAADPRASARDEVDRRDDLSGISKNPSIGGSFFEHLWVGHTGKAWMHADSKNRRILNELGVNERVARIFI
jgi:hypothetical protein